MKKKTEAIQERKRNGSSRLRKITSEHGQVGKGQNWKRGTLEWNNLAKDNSENKQSEKGHLKRQHLEKGNSGKENPKRTSLKKGPVNKPNIAVIKSDIVVSTVQIPTRGG